MLMEVGRLALNIPQIQYRFSTSLLDYLLMNFLMLEFDNLSMCLKIALMFAWCRFYRPIELKNQLFLQVLKILTFLGCYKFLCSDRKFSFLFSAIRN